MARLRYLGLRGTLGAALTTTGTTITFTSALTWANSQAVPTLSGGDYIPLSLLDPTTGLAIEVVYLTAYTTGATTGTITRAQEATSGLAHSVGDVFVNDATTYDLANSFAYTPSWTGSITNPSIGNGSIFGTYTLLGWMCWFSFVITTGPTTSYGSGSYSFSLPFAATHDADAWGEARLSGGNPYTFVGTINSTGSTFAPKGTPSTAGGTNVNMSNTQPATWANGTTFRFSGMFQYYN